MSTATFEGVVNGDRIQLTDDVQLPDKTKVYVVVPDLETKRGGQILSPRLKHPEQVSDFEKVVVEASPDAEV